MTTGLRIMNAAANLDRLTLKTNCPVPWATMTGDERVRFCSQCNKRVFNIESLSRSEAEKLISDRANEPCVRFYRRPDGTVVTRDCAPRFQRLRAAARLTFCLLM